MARPSVFATVAQIRGRARRRFVLRWLGRLLAGLGFLLALTLLLAAFLVGTETGSRWLLARILQGIDEGIPGSIEYRFAGGTFLNGLRAADVVIRDSAGFEVIRVRDLRFELDLPRLFDQEVAFRRVQASGVRVVVRQRRKWIGIVRAFVEPPEVLARRLPIRRQGPWRFDLPEVALRDVRVEVDLPSTALEVALPGLDAAVQAGRGSHRVEATASGEVALGRVGSRVRSDRVGFSGRLRSRSELPAEAELALATEAGALDLRLALQRGAIDLRVGAGPEGLRPDPLLQPFVPALSLGRVAALSARVEGPFDALTFAADLRSEAGAVEARGRFRSPPAGPRVEADLRLERLRPARLAVPQAPPDLEASARARLDAIPAAGRVRVDLAGLRLGGSSIPEDPFSGRLNWNAGRIGVNLRSDDGGVALLAQADLRGDAQGERSASVDLAFASSATLVLPGIAAAGPLDVRAAAAWTDQGPTRGRLAVATGGAVAAPAAGLDLRGAWRLRADVRPREGGGLDVAGELSAADDTLLAAAGVELQGPVLQAGSSPREPRPAPFDGVWHPSGYLQATLRDARAERVRLADRGVDSGGPVGLTASVYRYPEGMLSVDARLALEGDARYGDELVVYGPTRAEASVSRGRSGWRIQAGQVESRGVRRAATRVGPFSARLEPAASPGSSRLALDVSSLRSGRQRLGPASLRLTGDLDAAAGSLDLRAGPAHVTTDLRLRRTPADDGVEARFEGGLLRMAGEAFRFSGRVAGSPRGLQVPGLGFEGRGARGSIRGALERWRRLRFDARVDRFPVEPLLALLPGLEATDLPLEGGFLSVAAVAEGTLSRPQVEAVALVEELGVGPLHGVRSEATASYAGGDLAVEASGTISSGGQFVAEIRRPADGAAVAYAALSDLPLAALQAWSPRAAPLQGLVDDLSVLYSGEDRSVEVGLRLAGARWGDYGPFQGGVRVECRGRSCRDELRLEGPPDASLDLAGTIDLAVDPLDDPAGALAALARSPWRQTAVLAGLAPARYAPPEAEFPDGVVAGRAAVSGTPQRPHGHLALAVEGLRRADLPAVPPVRARLEGTFDPHRVRVEVRADSPAGDRAAVVARWDRSPADLAADPAAILRPVLAVHARVTGTTAAALRADPRAPAPFAGLAVDAAYGSSGATENGWTVELTADRPFLGDAPVRSAWLQVRGAGSQAAVTGGVRSETSEALRLSGRVEGAPEAGPLLPDLGAAARLDPAALRVDGRLRADGLSLDTLPLPAVVTRVTGSADLDLSAVGPLTAPTVAGSFAVRQGGFVLVPTAQRFGAVELAGRVEPGRVTLERLAAASGDGEVEASGTVDFPRDGEASVALRIDADEIPLVGQGAAFGWLSCGVDAAGTAVWEVPEGVDRVVSMRLGLEGCTVSLPRSRSRQVLEMGPHPDFVVAGAARPAPGEPGAADAEAAGPPWDVRVVVEAPGEFWVRREDLQMAGTGSVVFASRDGTASLGGRMEVRRGWLDMFGRRFDARFGDVAFTGRDPIDGALDIRMETETAEGFVYIDVTGTLRRPDVQLTSDPPRDQSEILALLYLGRLEATTEEQVALADRADAVAQNVIEAAGLAIFQSELSRRLGPLSVLRVDPGAQGLTDARVRAGMNILDNLYVEYTYRMEAEELQNSHEGRIEWLILRNLSLEGHFGDAQSGGVRLQYRTEW